MHATVRRWIPLALAAAVLLLSTGAGTVAAAGPEIVPVPDTVGRPFEEAQASLQALGFLVATYEVAGGAPGTVAGQRPAAGASLPVGGAVVLDVNGPQPTPTQAPNAVGLSPAAASSAFGSLYDLEFVAGSGAEGEKGKIVGQSPKMGDPIPLRGRLTLTFVPDDALPAQVAVPDAVGLAAPDAVKTVADAGLHARVARLALPGVPADLTVGQSPLPGTETHRYATVDVIVAVEAAPPPSDDGGQTLATVPQCVGLTEASARAEVTEAGLAAEVEWMDGDASAAFTVQAQDPEAGAQVARHSVVRLRIVRYAPPEGPPPPDAPTRVSMPHLVGMTAWQAESLLASLGLSPSPILAPNPSVPSLVVFAQQLPAGTWVDRGTAVAFRAAAPEPTPGPTPVPNFFGQTKAVAQLLAAAAGLNLEVLHIHAPTKPLHRVFSQSVAAWSVVPQGTRVTVWIASHPVGPALATVPNLIGKTAGQAAALLAGAGLSASGSEVVAIGKPPLKVFAQDPAPGTHLPAGSTVSFRVAKVVLALKHVPDVVGKTAAQATAALAAAGFTAQVTEQFAIGKPAGKVYDQSPNAGAMRPAGTVVAVKVAKPLVLGKTVPDLVGKTLAQANAALAAAGLSGTAQEVTALGEPFGKVFWQSPVGGTVVPAGTVVQFKVAKPLLAMATVPHLSGKTAAEAHAALAAAGLTGSATEAPALGRPPGRVYSQDPPAGAHVVAGTLVKFRVARPLLPAMRSVPDLIGKTKAEALAALSAAGLTGTAGEKVCLTCPQGRVTEQGTPAGTLVPVGTHVNFLVAKGLVTPAFVRVPALLGLKPSDAEAALTSRGLASDGSKQFHLGTPPKRVWWQSHTAGILVPRGTVVKWKATP